MNREMEITVNGKKRTVTAGGGRTLLEVLREDLGLTGTKYGCGEGQCGACTVLLDGKKALSCQTPAPLAEGRNVLTIEGLARGGTLHPVQQAFIDEGAMQCGYCVPGMILTAAGLLKENPRPGEEEILEAMNGNICRCSGYRRILNAVRRAAGTGGREVKAR